MTPGAVTCLIVDICQECYKAKVVITWVPCDIGYHTHIPRSPYTSDLAKPGLSTLS